MAEPYRIWLRRSDTHNRIVDEDIWVGNVPGDGKSKISSGYTQHSEEWAYVEFATWEDLLKAIGEEEETVQVLVTGQFEQIDNGEPPTPTLSISAPSTVAASGGTLTVTISSNTGWTLSTNIGSLNPTSGNEDGTSTLTVPENQGTGSRTITVTATGGGLTRTATITQSGATPPPPTPTYSLTVSAATNYDTTIDSTGTTKLVAVYSDGLGGNTAVTTSATWEVTSGQSYISVNNSGSNKGTVTGLDANDSQVTCKVKATFNGYEGTANITVRAKAGPTTHDIILDDVKFLVQHMGSREVDGVEFVSFRLYSSTTGATAAGKTFTNITEDTSASTSWDVTRFTVNNGDIVYGKLTLKVNPNSNTVLEHSGFVGNGGVSWNAGTLNTAESNPQTGIYVYDHYLVGYAVTTDVSFPDVVVKIDARNNGGQPTYSLAVNMANGYSSTIDSTGTTKLVATYYDGLGGSTAVTSDAEWLVTSGAAYVNIIDGTDPLTVEGRSNASGIDQKSKVMARFNGLTADIVITILQDPEVPPYIDLVDPDDLNYFVGLPCTGLPSPGYTVLIDTNAAWKARLSDIDDAYWLHMSYDNEGVTVYIDQNTDPYSGEGGSSRASSFIIEAVDSSLGIPSITINVSQGACDDLINIPNRDPFVFTCNGASSFTRNVEAWDDVQWHIVPVFGEWETPGWFSVSPTSGIGDGSFTVTILRDNYDNAVRGSGYLQIYTGSTQTYLDWDINVRQEPTPFFDVSGNSIHAASEGGNVSVTVYTNQPITASTTASWIKNLSIGNNVRVVGGTAYTIVTFTIEENSSVDQRDGNVTIGSTYSGPCGNFESENVQVLQDGADTDSATFIQVKKYEEPITAFRQEIEYPIQEADASTTAVTFNIWSDGKCKLTDISSATGHDGLRVVMVNGAVELDVTDGTPFDGTGVFKAIYGQAYIGHEKNFKITFEVADPGIITTSTERATVEITQERDYPIGVTGVTFENFGPHIVPNTTEGSGSCCAWNLTEMWIEIYAETLYKSGYRTHSSEAINNYIKTQGNLTGVDTDMLTLEVLNNPSSGQKYCLTWEDDIALADELHGGQYHPTFDYPFKIQFSPNTGTTTTTDPWADGFRRDVQFRLTYQDDDGNFAQEDFTVRVPYCNPAAPGTQDVYIISGGSHYDDVSIDVGVDDDVEIQVGGLVIGETRLSFDCDESVTTSILDNFEIQYESFDPSSPMNEWVATDTTQPIITFTRKSPYAFTFYIDCLRNGYDPVRLIVEFDDV